LQLQLFFEKVVIVVTVIEALKGTIEIVKGKRITAILIEAKGGEGISPVDKRG
jgi:hypothetical protein